MRFSIIVPTRNRPEYLPGTVRSALQQTESSNFEVVVFDNASVIPASEVLKDFSDPRLIVKRSDAPLAMRDSWEQALSYASGEFLTILGDDDAILPSAIKVSQLIIDKHDAKILRWDRAHYYWPNYKNSNSANLCRIPLGRSVFKIDAHWLLGQLGRMKLSYSASPTIYNSWIHRDIIQKVKTIAGRVFHSASPDVDSGFAFAYTGVCFYHINFPLSVCAQSAKSNGAQMHSECGGLSKSERLDVADDYKKLNSEASIAFDSNPVETVWGGIATSYNLMANVLNVPKRVFELDKSALFVRVLREEFPKMTSANKEKYLKEIVLAMNEQPRRYRQTKHYLSLAKELVNNSREDSVNHRPKTGYEEHLRHLVLDCSSFNVFNAHEAAILVENVLGLKDRFSTATTDWFPKSPLQNIKDLFYKVIKCRDYNFRGTQYCPGI